MCNRRTEMDRLQELVRLLLAGSITELPELELLKATIAAQLPPTIAPQMVSSVGRFAPTVAAFVAKGIGPRAICDRLRLEHADFDGTYWAIKRHSTGAIGRRTCGGRIASSPRNRHPGPAGRP